MPNDTHANVLLNILFQRYGKLPETYQIIGFDNSPISREAVIPLSTVGQQISVIANEAMDILSSPDGGAEEEKAGTIKRTGA